MRGWNSYFNGLKIHIGTYVKWIEHFFFKSLFIQLEFKIYSKFKANPPYILTSNLNFNVLIYLHMPSVHILYICMVFIYLHMHGVHILTYALCSYTYIWMVFIYLHMHGVHILYICMVFIYLHMNGVHILTYA